MADNERMRMKTTHVRNNEFNMTVSLSTTEDWFNLIFLLHQNQSSPRII